jgi:hypothetical protein
MPFDPVSLSPATTVRTIDGRTFEQRTSARGRTTYLIDGERVRADRFFVAESLSEGREAWKAHFEGAA